MRWYRLRYAPPEGKWPASVALYMPRLVTLAAAVLVRTDEGWRPVFDNQAGVREPWLRPLWAVLPAGLAELRQDRVIEVIVAAPVLGDGFYAVSSAWIGARESLEPRYRQRGFLQVGLPQATGLTLAVLGLFLLCAGAAPPWRAGLPAVSAAGRGLAAAQSALRPGTAGDAAGPGVVLVGGPGLDVLGDAAERHVHAALRVRLHPRFERALAAFVLLGSVLTLPPG